jgi:DNA anti-recombination protein RmuC
MTAAERARHELSTRLEEVLGPEQAATLMEHLPPVRWDELARQEDLLALRTDVTGLRTDVTQLQTDVTGLRTDMDQLQTDVADLRTATLLQGERLEHLSQVMTLRFDGLTDHITATVAQRMDSQTKLLVLSILGAFLTAVAISIGATAL